MWCLKKTPQKTRTGIVSINCQIFLKHWEFQAWNLRMANPEFASLGRRVKKAHLQLETAPMIQTTWDGFFVIDSLSSISVHISVHIFALELLTKPKQKQI